MGFLNDVCSTTANAIDTSFGGVFKILGGVGDIAETIEANTPKMLNTISGMFKGHVSAPDMASHVYIYFVRQVKDGYNYVGGFLATEYDKILQNLKYEFSHMIFVPDNLPEYGIPHIASGKVLYDAYGGKDADKLKKAIEKDKNHTYLATNKDVELLELRLKILGVGKVCDFTEVDSLVTKYIELHGECTLDETALTYQCIIDMAISATK